MARYFQGIDELIDKTLPTAIKFSKDLEIDEALSKFLLMH